MPVDPSSVCGESHPEQEALTCDRVPHPYGAHLHRASDTLWPGREQPLRPAKAPKGVRAKQVASLVVESGAMATTGAPDPLAARPAAVSDRLRPWGVRVEAPTPGLAERD